MAREPRLVCLSRSQLANGEPSQSVGLWGDRRNCGERRKSGRAANCELLCVLEPLRGSSKWSIRTIDASAVGHPSGTPGSPFLPMGRPAPIFALFPIEKANLIAPFSTLRPVVTTAKWLITVSKPGFWAQRAVWVQLVLVSSGADISISLHPHYLPVAGGHSLASAAHPRAGEHCLSTALQRNSVNRHATLATTGRPTDARLSNVRSVQWAAASGSAISRRTPASDRPPPGLGWQRIRRVRAACTNAPRGYNCQPVGNRTWRSRAR